MKGKINTKHDKEMIPPRIDGCIPTAGSVLDKNVICLFGNGFQYISNLPKVYQLPAKHEVAVDWRFHFDVHHPPDGQTGGSAPSEMWIWIERLEPGVRYRIEYFDFSADFTAGNDIHYEFPEKAAKPLGWLARLVQHLKRPNA